MFQRLIVDDFTERDTLVNALITHRGNLDKQDQTSWLVQSEQANVRNLLERLGVPQN